MSVRLSVSHGAESAHHKRLDSESPAESLQAEERALEHQVSEVSRVVESSSGQSGQLTESYSTAATADDPTDWIARDNDQSIECAFMGERRNNINLPTIWGQRRNLMEKRENNIRTRRI